MDLFGSNGSIILGRLQACGSEYSDVSINDVIEIMLWYIESYNPSKQYDDPVINAGNLAENRYTRRHFIRLIFTGPRPETKEASNSLFKIIADYLKKKKNNFSIISEKIDNFIKEFVRNYRIQISPVVLHDAEQARQKAETDARARGPQSYEEGPTATLVELLPHLGRGSAPSSDPDPLQHTFGNVDNPLRERILDIQKETRGVIVDLNDPATQIAVFNKLNENPTGPFYSPEEVMDEIDRLLTDGGGLPPPVIFPPGNFTPNQQGLCEYAQGLGWEYAMGPRDSPYFFPTKPGGAAAEEGGGNKRIKSKKNSKRRYKSKKRSNRRRRRHYSYKK
jgi:hypothetical protein